jgi:hypothetical protein
LELPARVRATDGAEVIDFPWASAASAMAAVQHAAGGLSASLEARAMMHPAIVDWRGAYRDEFDLAHRRLVAAAGDLVERAAGRAQSVVAAAEAANDRQRWRNERAAADERAGADDLADRRLLLTR